MTFSFLMTTLVYGLAQNRMVDPRMDLWAVIGQEAAGWTLAFAGVFFGLVLFDRWSYSHKRNLPAGLMTSLMANASRTIGFGLLAYMMANLFMIRDYFGLAWLSKVLFYGWIFCSVCFVVFTLKSFWQGMQYFLCPRSACADQEDANKMGSKPACEIRKARVLEEVYEVPEIHKLQGTIQVSEIYEVQEIQNFLVLCQPLKGQPAMELVSRTEV